MAEERVMLTRGGLKKLEAELHELRTVKRAEVAAQIREAQELGPDQLDAQYEDAKNQQAFLEGRISHKSPVGRALLGKKRGDTVTIKAPAGELEMTITTIA